MGIEETMADGSRAISPQGCFLPCGSVHSVPFRSSAYVSPDPGFAGVWPLMQKNIAVSTYASSHDQLRIDCGYRPDGTFKLFHAVSLRTDPDYAKSLAFSYPRLAAGIARVEKAEARLTAVIENDLDRKSALVAFAYEAFEESRIVVATLSEVPRLAELARKELRI